MIEPVKLVFGYCGEISFVDNFDSMQLAISTLNKEIHSIKSGQRYGKSADIIIRALTTNQLQHKLQEYKDQKLGFESLVSYFLNFSRFFNVFCSSGKPDENLIADFRSIRGYSPELFRIEECYLRLASSSRYEAPKDALIIKTSVMIKFLSIMNIADIFFENAPGQAAITPVTLMDLLVALNELLNDRTLTDDSNKKLILERLVDELHKKASEILHLDNVEADLDKLRTKFDSALEAKKQIDDIGPLHNHWERKRDDHLKNVRCIFWISVGLIIIGLLVTNNLLSFDGTCPTTPASTWVQFYDYAIRCWQIEKTILFVSVWAWAITQAFHFFRSQWHLYNDAIERIVMAESYKRLISECEFGSDKEHSSKAAFMILEALLRQSDDGLMKDSPKAHLLPVGLIKQSNN